MKILSVNNQQSQNQPMSFKALEKMVAGRSNRPGNYFTSLAVELTTVDLKKFGGLLTTFPLRLQPKAGRKTPENVIQIGIRRHGFAADSPFTLCVNHTDVFDSNALIGPHTQHLVQIKKLVARSLSEKNVSVAQTHTEKLQMGDVLTGDTGFTFIGDEKALGIGGVQYVVGIIKKIIDQIPLPQANA